jgi:hypothetical protein
MKKFRTKFGNSKNHQEMEQICGNLRGDSNLEIHPLMDISIYKLYQEVKEVEIKKVIRDLVNVKRRELKEKFENERAGEFSQQDIFVYAAKEVLKKEQIIIENTSAPVIQISVLLKRTSDNLKKKVLELGNQFIISSKNDSILYLHTITQKEIMSSYDAPVKKLIYSHSIDNVCESGSEERAGPTHDDERSDNVLSRRAQITEKRKLNPTPTKEIIQYKDSYIEQVLENDDERKLAKGKNWYKSKLKKISTKFKDKEYKRRNKTAKLNFKIFQLKKMRKESKLLKFQVDKWPEKKFLFFERVFRPFVPLDINLVYCNLTDNIRERTNPIITEDVVVEKQERIPESDDEDEGNYVEELRKEQREFCSRIDTLNNLLFKKEINDSSHNQQNAPSKLELSINSLNSFS